MAVYVFSGTEIFLCTLGWFSEMGLGLTAG
jgi:hypothetical protein